MPLSSGYYKSHCRLSSNRQRGIPGTLGLAHSSLAVGGVLLNEVEQPLDRILVVLVLLTFHNDLLATVNKLSATLRREIVSSHYPLGSVIGVVGVCSILLHLAVRAIFRDNIPADLIKSTILLDTEFLPITPHS